MQENKHILNIKAKISFIGSKIYILLMIEKPIHSVHKKIKNNCDSNYI